MPSRIYYRQDPPGVVLEQDGIEIAVYKNTEELVETHIKGLLARDHQDIKTIRELLQKYRPSEFLKS
jgi:hypothetical protein